MLGKILAAIGLALAFMGATLLNTAMARAETMDFELELPEGASIDAATMAGALIEALATAPDAQKPALVEALANVLRMNPEERIESPAIAMAPPAEAEGASASDQVAEAEGEEAAPADEGAMTLDLAIVRREGAEDEILLQWL
ncbi:hypothetical protein [Parapedomonas caeni]